MNNKRYIRLKEFVPGANKVHTPSDDYLKKSPLLEKNKSYFQKVDDNGFTGSHLNISNQQKVFLLGDSFIENIFVDESKRINSIMEEYFLLHEGKEIKVYNAGVSGSTGLNLLNLAINKIVNLNPDVIIYSQPSCDFSALLYKSGYYNNSKFFSNLYPISGNDSFVFETISENAEQIRKNIILLSKLCEINNIKLFISTCCSNSSRRQLKIMNDIIRENESLGYETIDLDNLVPKDSRYFYDKQHLNKDGSVLVSGIYIDKIKDFLTKNQFQQKTLFKNRINNNELQIPYKSGDNLSVLLNIDSKDDSDLNFELNIIYIKDGERIYTELKKIEIPAYHSIEASYYIKNMEQTEIILEPKMENMKLDLNLTSYLIK